MKTDADERQCSVEEHEKALQQCVLCGSTWRIGKGTNMKYIVSKYRYIPADGTVKLYNRNYGLFITNYRHEDQNNDKYGKIGEDHMSIETRKDGTKNSEH